MCWDAQAVILLRCLRVAQGGAKARTETQRMITEKVAALTEAQVAATVATLKGSKKHRVAKKALGVYARRVRRKRRLSKQISPSHTCTLLFKRCGSLFFGAASQLMRRRKTVRYFLPCSSMWTLRASSECSLA